MLSRVLVQNVANMAVASVVLLALHFLGIAGGLFWVGGLLALPLSLFLLQFRFAQGGFLLRLLVALLPWVVLCSLGMMGAYHIAHEGDRNMAFLYFEMPLWSVAAGAIGVLICGALNKWGWSDISF